MTLPNPVEVPDPNIDDPVLPEPVPEQEPPPHRLYPIKHR